MPAALIFDLLTGHTDATIAARIRLVPPAVAGGSLLSQEPAELKQAVLTPSPTRLETAIKYQFENIKSNNFVVSLAVSDKIVIKLKVGKRFQSAGRLTLKLFKCGL